MLKKAVKRPNGSFEYCCSNLPSPQAQKQNMDGTLDKQLNLQPLWSLIDSRFNEFKGRFDDIDNKIDTLSQSSSHLNDKVEILE